MTEWQHDRVGAALAGTNPTVMAALDASFAVIGDTQFLPGYTVAITNRLGVDRLSDLSRDERLAYFADVHLIADAVERACSALDPAYRRINVEILGNTDGFLHTHIFPRYTWEAAERQPYPVWLYPRESWSNPEFALGPQHDQLRQRITDEIAALRVEFA